MNSFINIYIFADELFEESSEFIKQNKLDNAEANLLNLYSFNNDSIKNKINILLLLSYIYWKKRDLKNLFIVTLNLNHKIDKLNQKNEMFILLDEDIQLKLIKTYLRTSLLLEEINELEKAFIIMNICKLIIKNINLKENFELITMINSKYDYLIEKISQNLNFEKNKSKDDVILLYNSLLNHIYLKNDFSLMSIDDLKEYIIELNNQVESFFTRSSKDKLNPNKKHYIIDKKWFFQAIRYIIYIVYMKNKSYSNDIQFLDIYKNAYKSNDYLNFQNQLFDIKKKADFFEFIYPGRLTNINIVSYKFPLFNNEFIYNPNKLNEDYILIEESLFKLLENHFGDDYYINSFIYKSTFLFKIFPVSYIIKQNNIKELSPKYISVNQSQTFSQFKKSILLKLNEENFKKTKLIEFKFTIIKKSNRKEILNIYYSMKNNLLSCSLQGDILYEEDSYNIFELLNEIHYEENLILIEIFTNLDEKTLKIKKVKERIIQCYYHPCGKFLNEVDCKECDFCRNFKYCSDICSKRDISHYEFHSRIQYMTNYIEIVSEFKLDYVLNNLNPELKNRKKGYVKISNMENYSHINSSIQSLINIDKFIIFYLLWNNINNKECPISNSLASFIKDMFFEINIESVNLCSLEILFNNLKLCSFTINNNPLLFLIQLLEKLELEIEERIISFLFKLEVTSNIRCDQCFLKKIESNQIYNLSFCMDNKQVKGKFKFFIVGKEKDDDCIELIFNLTSELRVIDIKNEIFKKFQISNENIICYVTSVNGLIQILNNSDKIKTFYDYLINEYNINSLKFIENQYKVNEIVFYELKKQSKLDEIKQSFTATIPLLNQCKEIYYEDNDKVILYIQPIHSSFSHSSVSSQYNALNKKDNIQPLFYMKPFEFHKNTSVKDLYINLMIYYRKNMNNIYPNRSDKEFYENISNKEYIDEEYNLHFEMNESGIISNGGIKLKFFNFRNSTDTCKVCRNICNSCDFNVKIRDKLDKIRMILGSNSIGLTVEFPKDYIKIKGIENILINSHNHNHNLSNTVKFHTTPLIKYLNISDLLTSSINIYDSYEKYIKNLKIKTKCGCINNNKVSLNHEITQYPYILMIELEKFNKNLIFDYSSADFPLVDEFGSIKYELISIICYNHRISSSFFTINRIYENNTGKWYLIVNDNVSIINNDDYESLKMNFYVLFYKKIN